ncbi:MAG: hypothetical protein NTU91_09210 [Chloroflexi bacterium]|jgi:hypothetical protein|nr:hypothetical protein [Chloroflexota bacterium]
MTPDLDRLWADLLSGSAALVLAALRNLPQEERGAALAHLHAMGHDPGWSEGQVRRARAALAIAAGDPHLIGPRPED